MGRVATERFSSLLGLWLLLCSWGCPGNAELRAPPDKIGRRPGCGAGGRGRAPAPGGWCVGCPGPTAQDRPSGPGWRATHCSPPAHAAAFSLPKDAGHPSWGSRRCSIEEWAGTQRPCGFGGAEGSREAKALTLPLLYLGETSCPGWSRNVQPWAHISGVHQCGVGREYAHSWSGPLPH